MPALTDPRQEAYASARIAGRSMTQSAIDAGYPANGAHNIGSRLNKRADVQRRMLELRAINGAGSATTGVPAESENTAEHTSVLPRERTNKHPIESKQWRTVELVSLYQLTRAMRQFAVSHQCLRTLALIHGDMEASTLPNKAALATLTGVAEIHAMLRQLMQEIPASERPALLLQAPELVDIVADSSDTPSQGV